MKHRTYQKQAPFIAGAIGAGMLFASASIVFALTDTTPPSVPTGLGVTPYSLSQINLSWAASTDDTGVTGYGVFRNGTRIASTSGTAYSDTGLAPGTNYTYAVNAVDATGNLSALSGSAATSTLADSAAAAGPAAPGGTPVSSSQINISWTASTDNVGVAGYRVYRDNTQIGTTSATSYADTGLSPATNHVYTVTAYDAAGNVTAQAWSVNATTFSTSSSDATSPSIPTNVSASAVSSSQINLSWASSTDNVGIAGYRVFRNGTQIGTTAGTSYSDSGLAASTNYTYAVAAYDGAGNVSSQSGSVNATTLATGSTATSSPARTVPPTLQIGANGNVTARGMIVTSVGTNTFTGTVWGVTYTVNYTGTNASPMEFYLRNGNKVTITPGQIRVGDEIGVSGRIDANVPTTIQAQVVRDYTMTALRPVSQQGWNNGNGHRDDDYRVVASTTQNVQQVLQQLMQQFQSLQRGFGNHR